MEWNFMKTPTRQSTAFTLVELLVVLATLALLAVMLLPALARSAAQPKSAACATNFRQWAVSANLYANDYQERLPSFNLHNGGSYLWDVGTGMCTNLGLYGLTLPTWFCPFRPSEWIPANTWAQSHLGHPIQNLTELSAYFGQDYPDELALMHNYWVQRNGANPPVATGLFPKDWSTVVIVPSWAKGASSTVYGWPKKLHDYAVAHVPFVSDKCYSGVGSGLGGTVMSTNLDTISQNSAHFVNGILIGVNAAYADGHVESHAKNQIVPAYANLNAYWFY
jgi:prepilin-type processing-associated H-X9-DG protein